MSTKSVPTNENAHAFPHNTVSETTLGRNESLHVGKGLGFTRTIPNKTVQKSSVFWPPRRFFGRLESKVRRGQLPTRKNYLYWLMKKRHSAPRRSQAPRQKKPFSTKAPRAARTASKPTNSLAVQSFEPDPVAVYSIETAAQLAGVPRRTILVYCKHGLISPTVDPSLWGYWFTADTIRTLRRIESLRHTCGDDFPGIAMILGLLSEVQTLRAQLRAFGG